MTTFSDESLQIISGTVTAWLPITTPWLSIAACSDQIYAQRAGLGGRLVAFDPLYGESIVPSAIPCLPVEVTSSWLQSNTAVTTVLGPTFVCPGAYSAVKTILVNSLTEQILCCPSEYSLDIPITVFGAFPSQCTSHLTPGEPLTYESTTPSGSWGVVTSTVPRTSAASTGPTIVYGMHVNGFNVISTATSTTASSQTTSAVSTSATETGSTASSGTTISKGAAAGIGLGLGFAVIGVLGIWFVFRRFRREREKPTYRPAISSQGMENSYGPHEVDGLSATTPAAQQYKQRTQSLHEMSTS